MNARDLRIGNLIRDKETKRVWRIVCFLGINMATVESPYFDFQTEDVKDIFISDFEGIPLTEEWLERFGFESDYDRILPQQIGYKKNGIILDSNFILTVEGRESDLHSLGKELKFVHELQNLYFALTGEELTLQNINS